MSYFSIKPVEVPKTIFKSLDGSEDGAIMIATGNGNMIDLVGDAVFDTAVPTYETLNSYDGQRDTLIITPGVTIRTTTAVDHQIPTASPVTYGGFFWLDYSQQNTPYLMCSSSNTGFSPINYGVAFVSNNFYRVQGGPSYGVPWIAPRETWFHFCVVENAGRTSSKLYLDGKLVSTKTPAIPGTVAGTDVLQIGQVNTATNGFMEGYGEQFFVMGAEYTDAQVNQLAANAFGHPVPI